MCQVCNDTGVVLDEQTYGMMFKPCNCEVAQVKQEQAKVELGKMLDKLRGRREQIA
ncbi:hypothetical protein [Aneurinibacillus migulanus]|uniref:hypothetical protein n=1 Tax=Aneurinibacillus migulanus TaxID=47500 RepID=UPI000FBBD35A|nr:hypothetical protein [Aneurinibacillus migulanus]MCP1359081.1 hypothetical protein [Aneurinibacillus migulanus]